MKSSNDGSNKGIIDSGGEPAREPAADPARALRRRAEEQTGEPQLETIGALAPEEITRLIHELRVHQIELELQNEELRRVQAELEASRTRYFDLYDLAPVGYLQVSETGIILDANLTAAALLGVARGALVKQRFSRFIVAEDHDIYYRHQRRLFAAGEPQTFELRLCQPDGDSFWARLESIRRDDPAGASVARLVMSDITEHLRLQDQLRQSQKMESVGCLAGGVAHDFNNMLGIILGYTDMALFQASPGTPLHDSLQEIRKAASRSADLTRQLLGFARRQPISPRVLDLNATVEGMLKMLRRLVGEDISLAWRPDTGLGPVKMDPSQIDQILANLCVNARDAIAGCGRVTIETANVNLDETERTDADFVPGDYVMLAVSDTGCGMDEEVMKRIFDPFFTTKEVGQGTGLGLATVYGIVKQNQGLIKVGSEPGRGTSLRIYLPRHAGAGCATGSASSADFPLGQGETVLLVEDEPMLLGLGKSMLQRLGYTVFGAATPDQALRLAREHADELRLLLTDVVMPEMNGRDLAELLKALQPKLKVLFMSGYTADIIAHHGVVDEGVQFIQKPFSLQELALRLRSALSGDAGKYSG